MTFVCLERFAHKRPAHEARVPPEGSEVQRLVDRSVQLLERVATVALGTPLTQGVPPAGPTRRPQKAADLRERAARHSAPLCSNHRAGGILVLLHKRLLNPPNYLTIAGCLPSESSTKEPVLLARTTLSYFGPKSTAQLEYHKASYQQVSRRHHRKLE